MRSLFVLVVLLLLTVSPASADKAADKKQALQWAQDMQARLSGVKDTGANQGKKNLRIIVGDLKNGAYASAAKLLEQNATELRHLRKVFYEAGTLNRNGRRQWSRNDKADLDAAWVTWRETFFVLGLVQKVQGQKSEAAENFNRAADDEWFPPDGAARQAAQYIADQAEWHLRDMGY